jgi:hypothetical protein
MELLQTFYKSCSSCLLRSPIPNFAEPKTCVITDAVHLFERPRYRLLQEKCWAGFGMSATPFAKLAQCADNL